MLAAQKMLPFMQASLQVYLAASASDTAGHSAVYEVVPKRVATFENLLVRYNPKTKQYDPCGHPSKTLDVRDPKNWAGHATHYQWDQDEMVVVNKGDVHCVGQVIQISGYTVKLIAEWDRRNRRIIPFYKRTVSESNGKVDVAFKRIFKRPKWFPTTETEVLNCKELKGSDHLEILTDGLEPSGYFLHRSDLKPAAVEPSKPDELSGSSTGNGASGTSGSEFANAVTEYSSDDGVSPPDTHTQHKEIDVPEKPEAVNSLASTLPMHSAINNFEWEPRKNRSDTLDTVGFQKGLDELVAADVRIRNGIINGTKRRRLVSQPSRLITIANKNK